MFCVDISADKGGAAPGARRISIPLAPTYHSLLNMT